jgi:hypothetical protein
MVVRPQWVWAFDDADGLRLDRPSSPVFTNQYDAEQWIGEQWRTVAAAGALTAHLLHDGTPTTPPLVLQVP